MMLRALIMVLPLAGGLCAGQPALAADSDAFYQRVLERVGSKRLERWIKAPDWVVREVSLLAHSYDPGQVLTRQAIAFSIRHARAKARARARRDLLEFDLDANAIITRDEMTRVALVLSGRARGLAWLRHRRADADGDGAVNGKELAAYAQRRALDHLDDAAARARYDLMALDLDQDGILSAAEAERARVILARAVPVSRTTGTEKDL